MYISIADLLLIPLVLVDDWYQHTGVQLLGCTVGAKPEFADSEMLTLMLANDFLSSRANGALWPFSERTMWPCSPSCWIRASTIAERVVCVTCSTPCGKTGRRTWGQSEQHFLLDTTPVQAVGYRRDKRHSDFRGSAEYGYCAARRLKYYGYKLVMLTTLDGTPYSFELVPANTDERDAADEILDTLPSDSNAWSDKDFISEAWQADWSRKGIKVWTTKRENQMVQNPPEFDRLLNRVRERVEGTFDLLKEGGRSVEHTLTHTVTGLSTRIIAKIAGGTFHLVLRRFCPCPRPVTRVSRCVGIDVLTYTVCT